MKKYIIPFLLVSFVNAEVSAFEAGNLDSSNPYGLTKDEKSIFKNKKEIENLKSILNSQTKIINSQKKDIENLKIRLLKNKEKIDTLMQKIEGITTILPSFAETSAKVDILALDLNKSESNISFLKNEFNNLKLVVSKNEKIDKKNTRKIINLIENIAKRLDKESNSKNEKIAKDKEVAKTKKVENINKNETNNSNDFKKLPLNKIFISALNAYKKRKFIEAYDKFYYLYEQKYKLSETLFYLGEIKYKHAHYKDALAFYKKSIFNLKTKNSYFTDDLVYHTGYSFEKIKNYESAKKSYLKLIHDFPNSILVKYAKKRLENLEKIK